MFYCGKPIIRSVHDGSQKLDALPSNEVRFFHEELNRIVDGDFQLFQTFWVSDGAYGRIDHVVLSEGRETAADGLGARLPVRWPQAETGKTPAFTIPAVSG